MNAVVAKATFQKFDKAFSELLQDWYNESSGVAQNFMHRDQSIVTLHNLKQEY